MAIEIAQATSTLERQGAYRLRYAVYVDELGYVQEHADSKRREIQDPLDDSAVLFVARDAGAIVGSIRYNWVTDVRGHYSDLYAWESLWRIDEFPSTMTTKFVVAPTYRGVLGPKLALAAYEDANARGGLFDFISSYHRTTRFFNKLGYRQYMAAAVDPEFGQVCPMVLINRDLNRLQQVRSPFLHSASHMSRHPDSLRHGWNVLSTLVKADA